MLKFGLIILLVNIGLKFLLGYGLWKMTNQAKSDAMKSSKNYNEEQIEEGNPDILKNQNNGFGDDNNNGDEE